MFAPESLYKQMQCNTLAYWAHSWVIKNEVLWEWPQGLYSQNFFFFITYEWAKWARVLFPGKFFQWSVMQQSSLLGPFTSYKEWSALNMVAETPFTMMCFSNLPTFWHLCILTHYYLLFHYFAILSFFQIAVLPFCHFMTECLLSFRHFVILTFYHNVHYIFYFKWSINDH